jgi:cobalt-zinc-cadmium efflux system protein
MTRSARLLAALLLNLLLVVGLAVVGITAHSLGVLAASADYLADAAGIGVAILAIKLSARLPRANAFAAAVNAGWLFVISVLVIASGIDRLVTGVPEVHGLPVLVMSGIAAIVMIAAAVILGIDFDRDDPSDEALSHRAVLLDTAADSASALGVAAAAAVILATGGWDWLDPAVALAIAVVVGWHAFALAKKAGSQLRVTARS